jgi:hypothetical protein
MLACQKKRTKYGQMKKSKFKYKSLGSRLKELRKAKYKG